MSVSIRSKITVFLSGILFTAVLSVYSIEIDFADWLIDKVKYSDYGGDLILKFLIDMGDIEKSLEYLERRPNRIELLKLYFRPGVKLSTRTSGDLEFRVRAVEDRGTRIHYLMLLGQAHVGRGNLKKARKIYGEVFRLIKEWTIIPSEKLAWLVSLNPNLCSTLIDAGFTPRAREVIHEAEKLQEMVDVYSSRLFFNFAIVNHHQAMGDEGAVAGKLEEIIKEYRKERFALQPIRMADDFAYRATNRFRSGQESPARHLLDIALEMTGDSFRKAGQLHFNDAVLPYAVTVLDVTAPQIGSWDYGRNKLMEFIDFVDRWISTENERIQLIEFGDWFRTVIRFYRNTGCMECADEYAGELDRRLKKVDDVFNCEIFRYRDYVYVLMAGEMIRRSRKINRDGIRWFESQIDSTLKRADMLMLLASQLWYRNNRNVLTGWTEEYDRVLALNALNRVEGLLICAGNRESESCSDEIDDRLERLVALWAALGDRKRAVDILSRIERQGVRDRAIFNIIVFLYDNDNRSLRDQLLRKYELSDGIRAMMVSRRAARTYLEGRRQQAIEMFKKAILLLKGEFCSSAFSHILSDYLFAVKFGRPRMQTLTDINPTHRWFENEWPGLLLFK